MAESLVLQMAMQMACCLVHLMVCLMAESLALHLVLHLAYCLVQQMVH